MPDYADVYAKNDNCFCLNLYRNVCIYIDVILYRERNRNRR